MYLELQGNQDNQELPESWDLQDRKDPEVDEARKDIGVRWGCLVEREIKVRKVRLAPRGLQVWWVQKERPDPLDRLG